MKKLLIYIIPFAFAALVSSCHYTVTTKPGYEYMPDMYRSPSYETYSSNPNFPDSITARQPVKGTIARGDAIFTDLDRMPYAYENTPEGYELAGAQLKSPIPISPANLAEGKRLYFNYCQACHGASATGGMGPKLAKNPILKHDDLFWETVLHGRGPMPAWGSVLSQQDIADIHTWLLTK